MQQRFILPENCGTLQSVSYVNVKPQYEQDIKDDHVVLTGIYLIQVELKTIAEGNEPRATDGILIEEVDLDNQVAYFEYGLPLSKMLDGENPVTDYQMEKIEVNILPGGVLEIQAHDSIARMVENPVPAQADPPIQVSEPIVKTETPEPVAALIPEKPVEEVRDKRGASGIVEWLSLSKQYKTEKIQLNPILKQSVANNTENE